MKIEDKEKWVNQKNSLVEGRQNLKLNSAKLVRIAIMQIRMGDKEFKPCKITIKELSELFEVAPTNLYQTMPAICKELAKSIVEVKEVHAGRVYYRAIPWVSEIEYDSDKGVTILLNYKLKDQLLDLRQSYTRYFLEEILTMKSVYAIRLFELLMNRKQRRILPLEGVDIEISLQDIKEACGCTSKAYDSFHNVKNRVIEAAVKEINEKSNYYITYYSFIKERKSVVAINFHLIEYHRVLKQRAAARAAQTQAQA